MIYTICRKDQGTEFTGGHFSEVMKQEEIEGQFAEKATPEHNDTAERFNKTLQEGRAFMFDSGLSKIMWSLAAEAAVHSYNRTRHKSINKVCTHRKRTF